MHGLLLTSRPPLPYLPPPRLCASDESPFAGLVICTNTNICGKQNPTFTPGFGFASRAIECLRVLGPPGLVVNSGPCFIRCSSGVNAKLVLPEGQSAAKFNGCELRQGRPFYQLNSVDECVLWLQDNLALQPPADKLRAYAGYVDAIEILETRGDDSPARRASLALPLLDVAATYALASEPDSWPEPPAAQRRAWPGSVWEESFYGTKMWVQEAEAGAAAGADEGEGEGEGDDPERFAGGSASEAEQALAAASRSLGRSQRRAPKPTATGGDVRCSYGGAQVRGVVQGRAAGSRLTGRWEEADGGPGDLRLTLSSNGLRFDGMARIDGKRAEEFAWSGVRRAPPLLASGGTPEQRWHGAALSLRARAYVSLGRGAEALDDAAAAARRCPWLPEAWETLSDAALASGLPDVARMALEELLYLQPADAADQRGRSRWEARSSKSLALPNQRRTQAITLSKLRRKELGTQPAGSSPRRLALSREQQAALGHVFAPAVFDEAGRAVVVAGEAPGRAPAVALDMDNSAALDAQLDAIFVDSYEVDTGEERRGPAAP